MDFLTLILFFLEVAAVSSYPATTSYSSSGTTTPSSTAATSYPSSGATTPSSTAATSYSSSISGSTSVS